MSPMVSPAADGSARAFQATTAPAHRIARFRAICRCERRQNPSNRRPLRCRLRSQEFWPPANWPPIGHRPGLKVPSLQANYEYRYRDSNPGFRRERAFEHPAPSRKIRHFQGKHELGGIAERPNCSGDVRIWFGRLFSSRSRFQASQPNFRSPAADALDSSSGSGRGMVQSWRNPRPHRMSAWR